MLLFYAYTWIYVDMQNTTLHIDWSCVVLVCTPNATHRLCSAAAIFISGDCPALFGKAFVTEKNKAILCDSSGEVNLLMDRTFLKWLVKY